MEIQQETARAREKRMDDALRLLVPHVPRLVAAVTRATVGEPALPASATPAPAATESAPSTEGDDGAAVLSVLSGMPPEAVAMLADVMRGEGKNADADKLLAVHARLKGKGKVT